jgi:hypothetical protein
MKINNRFCKVCGKDVSWTIGDLVIQKVDIYHVTCEKGHIGKMFISKNLMKVLKQREIINK